ncbi:MAG: TlpA family protein disulfide reductase [Epsilonproteobacteria bacterium]|nr:TlpA family protein disulfide reductase [Campylobacterota bacterium]
MKNNLYIFVLILTIFILGCNDNKESNKQPSKLIEEVKKIKKPQQPKPIKPKVYNFKFTNLENQTEELEVKNNHYDFKNIKQPIVFVNFLASWCPPCIGQIPHLNKLHQKYKSDLYILGILKYDKDLKDEDIDKFITSQKINFFISKETDSSVKFSNFIAPKLQLKQNFSLPLMILFVKGKYYTHYEGSIPEEMIESDIKQALNKIKGQ